MYKLSWLTTKFFSLKQGPKNEVFGVSRPCFTKMSFLMTYWNNLWKILYLLVPGLSKSDERFGFKMKKTEKSKKTKGGSPLIFGRFFRKFGFMEKLGFLYETMGNWGRWVRKKWFRDRFIVSESTLTIVVYGSGQFMTHGWLEVGRGGSNHIFHVSSQLKNIFDRVNRSGSLSKS